VLKGFPLFATLSVTCYDAITWLIFDYKQCSHQYSLRKLDLRKKIRRCLNERLNVAPDISTVRQVVSGHAQIGYTSRLTLRHR